MTGRTTSSLRVAIGVHQPARGKRYEPALKARIIEFAQARRAQGATWVGISNEIGLGFETLRRWCQKRKPSTAMVPVRLVAERPERVVSVSSAGGYRIEDLTLHEAVAVLRALG